LDLPRLVLLLLHLAYLSHNASLLLPQLGHWHQPQPRQQQQQQQKQVLLLLHLAYLSQSLRAVWQ
jgi:hypothetical protein